MHLAGRYLDFSILMPPLFEQEIVQIRQGQKQPIRDAGTDFMALPDRPLIRTDFLNRSLNTDS